MPVNDSQLQHSELMHLVDFQQPAHQQPIVNHQPVAPLIPPAAADVAAPVVPETSNPDRHPWIGTLCLSISAAAGAAGAAVANPFGSIFYGIFSLVFGGAGWVSCRGWGNNACGCDFFNRRQPLAAQEHVAPPVPVAPPIS